MFSNFICAVKSENLFLTSVYSCLCNSLWVAHAFYLNPFSVFPDETLVLFQPPKQCLQRKKLVLFQGSLNTFTKIYVTESHIKLVLMTKIV